MTYKLNRKSSRSTENQKPESGTITVAGAPYESGPDPEFRDLPQPLPPGFLNLGNTCYINVTLQCLFTVHPLLQWLLKGGTSSFPPNQRLTDSLSALVAATFRRKCKSELQKFRDLVGILHPEFKEAREQDAQEFLLFLLNRLHEENVLRTGNSEVQRIFAGEMRTSVACSHCWVKDQAQTSKEKTSFFKGKSTSECPAGEVFLSLSLPIPLQEEQIDGATLGADPRHLRHRVVLNELIQQPTPSWRQRRLSFDSKTTIESVYKQVDALVESSSPQLASSASQSSYARMAAVAFSSETAEFADATSASGLASSTSLKTPFLLVQATASGFGAWFLDETGLGANLVDGLDLEAICGPLEPSNLQTRQDNFLYGDSLFLVHLKNSLTATMVDDYRNSCTENMVGSLTSHTLGGTCVFRIFP
ncbi:unnamed protein product [Schistocephalus solidus]|uniref:ubiquitinyl hydrolase 1 n=1 Tax=Schistocephalus solidus TaxID=70667 RepID=A0A183SEL8_SCHSO|nr:unnamed protein product [Schistocephalus solidus]